VEELNSLPLAGLLVTAVHREGQMQGTDLPLMEDVAAAYFRLGTIVLLAMAAAMYVSYPGEPDKEFGVANLLVRIPMALSRAALEKESKQLNERLRYLSDLRLRGDRRHRHVVAVEADRGDVALVDVDEVFVDPAVGLRSALVERLLVGAAADVLHVPDAAPFDLRSAVAEALGQPRLPEVRGLDDVVVDAHDLG
jgi:hypothetical protein